MISIEVGQDDRVAVSTGREKWFCLWPAVGGAKLELWLQFQRFTDQPDPPPL
ncbi:hypothetical protein SAMN04489712_14420 [Thermomonospora echinospora]|uniref:Uncharacterized protein n=1 Tax=Thermomonospora echinospora TaxID=1992 RepID=A0A1H6EBD2_9ACTN|nr:hypothetical protein [Thermomonospora echinospora]SEG94234.1 hypothetical protein SAMN04489712_14420 [Thermomonospora echinospora]